MRISTARFQTVSISNVLEQQAKLTKLQQQLSTGRRILTPADDPAGAAQALQLAARIGNLERLQQNATLAGNQLGQEEVALEQVSNLIQRVRDLTLDAKNDSKAAADRNLIAAELRERFNELLQIANAQDGNGEYLFAGAASREAPFHVVTGREVAYTGDQTIRYVQVGPTRQLPVNHTGFDVFMRIPDGSGSFVARSTAKNQGSALIENAHLVAGATYSGSEYRLRFEENTAGELVYLVERDGELIVPAPPATDPDAAPVFVAGERIEFDGVSLIIRGEPVVGDSIEVAPAGHQSLFQTLDELITVLEQAEDTASNRAHMHNVLSNVLDNLDSARENILRVRAEVGSRLHAIDAETEGNADTLLALQTTRSKLEDLDYASAISDFSLQLVGLQAAQKTYLQVQGLSLFNLL